MNKAALLVILAGAFVMAVCAAMPSGAQMEGSPRAVLCKDPVYDVAAVEDHSEVLPRWAARGIRNAVLLHIDAHDDIQPIPDEKIQRLKELYEAGDLEGLRAADSLTDRGLYNLGNFVYAAARLGIIRKAYWILPFDTAFAIGGEEMLKRFLRRNRFSDSDISSFRMHEGCFTGTVRTIPLGLCGINSLPRLDGPVVVSLDADFIPPLSAELRTDKLGALRALLSALREKHYRVSDVSVAYSVNGGFLQPQHRWIGDALAAMIKTPGGTAGARRSAPWQTYQNVDSMASRFLSEGVIKHIERLPAGLEDPGLLLYASDAYYDLNNIDMAFETAARACLADRRYCFGLPQIGRFLLREDRLREAERFFERGRMLNPGALYFQWELALALKRAGRYEDALARFHELKPLVGAYPLELLVGEVYLLRGDRRAAAEHGRLACNGLDHHPEVRNDLLIRDAIRDAMTLYEKSGMGGLCLRMTNY